MFPIKTFLFCLGTTLILCGLGYYLLAGSGSLYVPTDATRQFVTGAFCTLGVLSYYGVLYQHRKERDERIAQEDSNTFYEGFL
jgi:cytochrome c biogenesis protein CcdA